VREVSRAAFYFISTKDDVAQTPPGGQTTLVEALKRCPKEPRSRTSSRSSSARWRPLERGRARKLLIEVRNPLQRSALAEDRRAELVRHTVAERFLRAGQDGEVSSMIPPELLADFFLLNCMAAMASW
jgi:hypothetical protein